MKNIRITLLVLVFGTGIIKPLFEDYKAFEAYKGQSFDKSIKYLQVKQIENPHDPELNYNLGVAHFRGAQYANALKDFERVVENADENNPLRVEALYNAGNSLVKETERVLGPDWEAKKVEDKKIDSALKDLERAVVRYSQARAIKESPDAQQNQAYAEKLIEKLKQKKQQQQQQDKNKDDKKDDKNDKDKDDKDKDKNKDKNQDGKDDGQNSSDGDDKKGNDSPDKKDKKDKGKDKKDKGSKDKDKDSGKDDKNKKDDKDKSDEDKDKDGEEGDKDKEKPKDKGKDKKDQGQDPQDDDPNKKPGDYKKEKQPESEGDEKEEGDKPQEPQKGGAAPQEQEQGSDDQSPGSAAGGEQGQQQDAVYDVLKADDSMEKKAMRALLDDLDEKEAAKQKALMQYQSKSAATSGELGQKPW